jgi:hypothetical protein
MTVNKKKENKIDFYIKVEFHHQNVDGRLAQSATTCALQ